MKKPIKRFERKMSIVTNNGLNSAACDKNKLTVLNTLFSFIILLLLPLVISAQEVNIIPYLKSIEEGNKPEVISALTKLKKDKPNDPSVIFLDAVLTENGEEALKKYEIVYDKYPESNYADAALYRIFSYYYSLGVYNKADNLLTKLKNEFPASPYIKAADRNMPDYSETAAAEPAPAKQITEPGNYNFTIQAGAFLNIENAKNLAQRIENDGYYSELSTKSVGGSLLNVVTFGRLQTEEDAAPLLVYLKNEYKLNGRVISVK